MGHLYVKWQEMEISPLLGGLWKFEKMTQNQPLSKKVND